MEDILYKFLPLYHSLPLPVRQASGKIYNMLPFSLRYGNFYSLYSKRIEHFLKIDSYEGVLREQEKILIEQVNNSIERVPYYSKYNKIGTLDEFRKLEIIDKETVSQNMEQFLYSPSTGKRLKANTGGSSGTPMEFFIEKHVSRAKEKAHFMWYWGQFGYKPGNRMLMARGLPLSDYRLYEYLPIDNMLSVSCYNINESNISNVAQKIRNFRPMFIYGYPSSLRNLVMMLKDTGYLPDYEVKAIFCGSEYLGSSDRELLSGYFGARAVNWYGHSERLVHGGNCPFSDLYHFYPAYGYMELVDDKGNIVESPGAKGRIVATGFDNKVMPFIRYDTGDTGILSSVKSCSCGFRGISLKKIHGRGQDFIYLNDGTRVSLTAFIFGQHLDAFSKIREMQVVQRKKGVVEINIVTNSDFSHDDEKETKYQLLKSVNNKLAISFNYPDMIPKTHRGKNIFFVSELNDHI